MEEIGRKLRKKKIYVKKWKALERKIKSRKTEDESKTIEGSIVTFIFYNSIQFLPLLFYPNSNVPANLQLNEAPPATCIKYNRSLGLTQTPSFGRGRGVGRG